MEQLPYSTLVPGEVAQYLYVAHACRDNDVLSDEYYSKFTDLVIKQLKLVE